MMRLPSDGPLEAAPRRPYEAVYLSEQAHAALSGVQRSLRDHGIELAVTRGYENQGAFYRHLHAIGRTCGAFLFLLLYPRRRREIPEIFAPNGHDTGGDCVDLSFKVRGQKASTLPLGVFTPLYVLDHRRKKYGDSLAFIYQALDAHGFDVHPNPTEALQIHCALRR